MTLADLTVSGGRGGENEPYNFGGGIDSEGGGALTLERVVVSSNFSHGAASWGDGGGLSKLQGRLVIRDSALLSNSACCFGYGGALYLAGESTSAELVNVTIAGNESSGEGGGIEDEAGGTVTLAFVTIVGNLAGQSGGGIGLAAHMHIRDSIVVGNSAEMFAVFAGCFGKPTSEGGNLAAESCGLAAPSDAITFDAGLAPLSGSPVPVMEPLPGSPAIDRAVGPCPPTDARGVPRPQGPGCDTGAAERVVPPPSGTSPGAGGQEAPLVAIPALTIPALTISSVRETNPVWRLGNRLARLSAHRAPVGTVFSFALTSAARVRFEFVTHARGRRVNGRCILSTRSNRHARSCRRTLKSGTLALAGHQGTNRLSFQGRLSSTRTLTPGRYTLTIAASGAGGRSYGRPLSFTIVR